MAVCAVLSGADPFVEIEAWGNEKRDGLRKSLRLEQGIACHDTFGRAFAARDADEFAAAFLRWVGQGVPALAKDEDEKTAFPERLATLALEGCLITIDAMGTQPNTAQAIRHRGADYLLAVKDNQPTLAESIGDFINAFAAVLGKTPHRVHEVVEKDPAGWKSGAATSSTSSTACTHPTRSA